MLEDPKKYGDEFGTRDLSVILQDRISDQVQSMFRWLKVDGNLLEAQKCRT